MKPLCLVILACLVITARMPARSSGITPPASKKQTQLHPRLPRRSRKATPPADKNLKPLHILRGHTDFVGALAFSPDGKVLATGSTDCTLKVWDAKTWSEWYELRLPLQVTCVAFSPGGKLMASGSGSSKPLHKILSDGSILSNVVVSEVWIHDTASGQEQHVLECSEGLTTSVSFSPDGKMLAAGGSDGTITLWDVARWKKIQTFPGSKQAITSLAFSRDSHELASVDVNTVILWDPQNGKPVRTLVGHTSQLFCVTYSPQVDILASAGSDNRVKLWNSKTGKEIASLAFPSHNIDKLAFSPDGKMLAAACSGPGSHVELWDTAALRQLDAIPHAGAALAYSPDGKLLATDGDLTSTVQILRAAGR